MDRIYGVTLQEPWGQGSILTSIQQLIDSSNVVVVDPSVIPVLADRDTADLRKILRKDAPRILSRMYSGLDRLLHEKHVVCEQQSYDGFAKVVKGEKELARKLSLGDQLLKDYARMTNTFRMPERGVVAASEQMMFDASIDLMNYVAELACARSPAEVASQVRTFAYALTKAIADPSKGVLILTRNGLYPALFDASIKLGYRTEFAKPGQPPMTELLGNPQLRVTACHMGERDQPYQVVCGTKAAESEANERYQWRMIAQDKRETLANRVLEHLYFLAELRKGEPAKEKTAVVVAASASTAEVAPAKEEAGAPQPAIIPITPTVDTKQGSAQKPIEVYTVQPREVRLPVRPTLLQHFCISVPTERMGTYFPNEGSSLRFADASEEWETRIASGKISTGIGSYLRRENERLKSQGGVQEGDSIVLSQRGDGVYRIRIEKGTPTQAGGTTGNGNCAPAEPALKKPEAPKRIQTSAAPASMGAVNTKAPGPISESGLRMLYNAFTIKPTEIQARFERGELAATIDGLNTLEQLARQANYQDLLLDIAVRRDQIGEEVKKTGEFIVAKILDEKMETVTLTELIHSYNDYVERAASVGSARLQESLVRGRAGVVGALEQRMLAARETRASLEAELRRISGEIEVARGAESRYAELSKDLRELPVFAPQAEPVMDEAVAQGKQMTAPEIHTSTDKSAALYQNIVTRLGREPTEGEALPKAILPVAIGIDPTSLSTLVRKANLTAEQFTIAKGARNFVFSRKVVDALASAFSRDSIQLLNPAAPEVSE